MYLYNEKRIEKLEKNISFTSYRLHSSYRLDKKTIITSP